MGKDVIYVDPLKKLETEELDQRKATAKEKVMQASAMLEKSNGQLDGSMWHALYLSFDLPNGCDTRAHRIFTAIPRNVLGHIKVATGMEIYCNRLQRPNPGCPKIAGRSSKVQALLDDLPENERSVVFTGTREGILHLLAVLDDEGIGCRALFTGQKPAISEKAVTEWEKDHSDDEPGEKLPFPILIVQAGAAASGLTLIKACKIFLLEPFSRQEEEHQAYARCHRYGQQKDVRVRCYYSPVTVESRLLERRKKNQVTKDSTDIIFSTIKDESHDKAFDDDMKDSEEEEEEEESATESNEDTRRSLFLLGLANKNGDPCQIEAL